MKLILPVVLLLLGTGGGVGAALFLAPPEPEVTYEDGMGPCGPTHEGASEPAEDVAVDPDAPPPGLEYARLNNQFIVPVVQDERVTAMVVLSLSVEVEEGSKDMVFQREPRLRDALLQVMFDHANLGGFDGVFTAADNMGNLRAAMRTVARDTVGTEIKDVLILDVVRQAVPG